ncbi:TIGR04282 family arsenosugar biosynthesis glycosyltransferase [Sciscionella sediminilitoris]|uniref:TIGR04282 family arsenosugar biosynthesis glycosyltransferase n=1 Tax=Sciscionella sediminilitoris TaxID=1445613 RepID=UPI0004DEE789|nr:DUF2064 domain-containing protein [Sciscionella sp. SE31]
MSEVCVLVLAKAPVPGRVKTRLCPQATPEQAAAIAAAALLDTLDAVRASGARGLLALSGAPGEAVRAGELAEALRTVTVFGQRGTGLAERIAHAHADAAELVPGAPVLQIGMDTPQVSPALLAVSGARLYREPAVLGPADDGGWWALGLRDPLHAKAITGVPMSTPDTCTETRAALRESGVTPGELPALSDVDTMAEARAVAALIPRSRFAAVLRALR